EGIIPDALGTVYYFLLPFFEQDNLYRQSKDYLDPPTNQFYGYYPPYQHHYSDAIKTLVCPSDPSVDTTGQVTDDQTATDDPPYNPWGACSYPVNAQVFCNVKLNDPKDPDGTFVNSEGNPRIGTITDGLSNTIFIGEKYARCTNSVFNGGSYWAYWN